jgi:hypothetical protein
MKTNTIARLIGSATLALLLMPPSARGNDVTVAGADLIGFRSTTNGLIGAANWTTANGGMKISWIVGFDAGSNLWSYSYTFARLDDSELSGPGLSHWILELSTNVTAETLGSVMTNANFSLSSVLGPQTWGPAPGNPNLAVSFFGVKFELGQANFSFQSTRAPVWGDFYAKGGSSSTAQNTGIGGDPTLSTTDVLPWIPTPDTSVVPEPSPLVLVVAGLGVVACLTRRRAA